LDEFIRIGFEEQAVSAEALDKFRVYMVDPIKGFQGMMGREGIPWACDTYHGNFRTEVQGSAYQVHGFFRTDEFSAEPRPLFILFRAGFGNRALTKPALNITSRAYREVYPPPV
jgi:hypothetical protein